MADEDPKDTDWGRGQRGGHPERGPASVREEGLKRTSSENLPKAGSASASRSRATPGVVSCLQCHVGL